MMRLTRKVVKFLSAKYGTIIEDNQSLLVYNFPIDLRKYKVNFISSLEFHLDLLEVTVYKSCLK